MMEIRSYRRVFDLERRVYSVDRLRLNPSGVPVRGIVYFARGRYCGALAGLRSPAARASASIWSPGICATCCYPGWRPP